MYMHKQIVQTSGRHADRILRKDFVIAPDYRLENRPVQYVLQVARTKNPCSAEKISVKRIPRGCVRE